MEADILDISPVGVWRHTSTTASASGGQNKTNSSRTHWVWDIFIHLITYRALAIKKNAIPYNINIHKE